MKNLIILLFIYISFLLHTSWALGMEKDSKQEMYDIVTSDNCTSKIPKQYLDMCKVITTMLYDLPNNTDPLPLPISSSILPLVKKCLKNNYIMQNKNNSEHLRLTAQQELEKLLETQPNLHAIVSFAHQLEAPHLLKHCIKKWATTDYIPTKEYPLTNKINIAIAQHMPQSKLLIDNVAGWVIKNLEEKKTKFREKILETPKSLLSAAISKDGNLFAAGDSMGTITIYNYGTEKYLHIKTQHKACHGLQFDDGQILSSGKGNCIKIWNLNNFDIISFFYSPSCRANVFRYIPNYKLLIADSTHNQLCVWDIKDSKNINPKTIKAHDKTIFSLESSYDNSLFSTGSSDRYACVWDTATQEKISSFYHATIVMSTYFNHTKNKLLCGLENGDIFLYDLATAQLTWNNDAHAEGIWSVLFSDRDDTLFCSGSQDSTIKIWDHRTCKCLKTLYDHTDDIQAMAIDQEKNKLLSVSIDQAMNIWDLRNLVEPIKTLRNEISDKCTIEHINNFSKKTLNTNNPLLTNFSSDAQKFLSDKGF